MWWYLEIGLLGLLGLDEIIRIRWLGLGEDGGVLMMELEPYKMTLKS